MNVQKFDPYLAQMQDNHYQMSMSQQPNQQVNVENGRVSNNFVSPFYSELNLENQLMPTFTTPQCYNTTNVPALTFESLKDFDITILFFIFYNYSHDIF